MQKKVLGGGKETLELLYKQKVMFGNYMDQNYQLIGEVKKHRLLWDPKFRDLSANAQVWNQIAKAVKLPARACRDRFKNLRDTFLRILKKNSKETSDSGSERRCKWAYFKEMLFLLEVLDQKLTTNATSDTFEDLSVDNEETGEIVSYEEAQSSEDGIVISEVLEEEESLILTRSFADVEDSSSMTSNNFDEVVTTKAKRGRVTSKRKNQENELFKKFKRFQKWDKVKFKSKNSDRAQLFADSLVNHLEKVPNELWGLCTLQMTQLAVMFSNGVIPHTLINPMSTTTSEVPVIVMQEENQA